MPPAAALKKIRLWVQTHVFGCLLALVILPVSFSVSAKPADYLISLVRHGDRSPRSIGDQSELWPMGPGQLTIAGMEQMRQLGLEIRRRYFRDDFPQQWNFKLSSHYSKGINRTIQSAMALLQGVYPPLDQTTGIKGNIQIPPVYAPRLKKDVLFSSQHICAGYVHFIQELEESAQWQQVRKKYDPYLNKWQKLAGVNGGLYPLASYLDRVSIHDRYGLPLPDGVSRDDAEKMKELLNWLLVQLGHNQSIIQLIATPLIKSFISELQQVMSCMLSSRHKREKQEKQESCQKWTLYLGSDINLIAVMGLLGVNGERNIQYASHLEIQMNWREPEPGIIVYFDNEPVQLPRCKTPCLLDNFLEMLNRSLPERWEELCNLGSGPTLSTDSKLAHPVPDSKKAF